MSFPRRSLSGLAALAASTLMLAGAAGAQAAVITVNSPADGSYVNNLAPTVEFSGAVAAERVYLRVVSSGALLGSAMSDSAGHGFIPTDTPLSATPASREVSLELDDDSSTGTTTFTLNQVPSFVTGEGTTDEGDAVTNERISFNVTGAIPDLAPDTADTYIRLHTYSATAPSSDSTFEASATGAATGISPNGPALEAGEHTAYVTTEDADHVESSRSEEVTFTVALAPSQPEFKDLFDGAQLNRSQPALKLTGIDPDTTEVTLYHVIDVDGVGTVVELDSTATIDHATHTAEVTPTLLPEGLNGLIVKQTARGVESDELYPTQVNVHVNTSAPVLDKGFDGELTNEIPWFHIENALESYGDGENTNTVELYIDGNLAGSDGTDGGGNAGIHPENLSDGAHTAYAVTRDDLGNLSATRSNEVTFTLDTIAPGAPTFLSPTDGSALATSLPLVSVRAEPGTRLVFIVDYAGEEGSAIADADGNATFQVTQALADGEHALSALAIDDAGNWDNGSATYISFAVKTAATPPPVVTPPVVTPPVLTPPTDTTPTPTVPTKVTLSSSTLTKSRPITMRFTLKKTGTVKVTITRTVKGKTVKVATVNVKYKKAGKVTYKLKTKVGGKTLKKGKYKVALQTVNGKKTSKAVSEKVTVR